MEGDFYFGMDVAQVIFAGAVIMILVIFAIWGLQTRTRLEKVEQALRDFRELEPEGYEEEDATDAMSEGARLESDEEAARQRRFQEHGA